VILAFRLIHPATFNIETFANANINVHKKDSINSLLISCFYLNGVWVECFQTHFIYTKLCINRAVRYQRNTHFRSTSIVASGTSSNTHNAKLVCSQHSVYHMYENNACELPAAMSVEKGVNIHERFTGLRNVGGPRTIFSLIFDKQLWILSVAWFRRTTLFQSPQVKFRHVALTWSSLHFILFSGYGFHKFFFTNFNSEIH
jgi:hypothetical protein